MCLLTLARDLFYDVYIIKCNTMKKINTLCTLLFILFSYDTAYSQELFQTHVVSKQIYHNMLNNPSLSDTSIIRENTIFLEADYNAINKILNYDIETLNFNLPFYNDSIYQLELSQFSIYSDSLSIIRHTNQGQIFETYSPKIKTYRITNSNNYIRGVFIFSETGVQAIFTIDNEIYQINYMDIKPYNIKKIHFISNVNHSPVPFDFICMNELLTDDYQLHYDDYRLEQSTFGCIELAIEIDYYTFQTFDSYQSSVDWALSMISVVSELFMLELEIGINSNTAQIWEVEDPYSSFIEEPQNMLISIRENWLNNDALSSVDRDLVHLFSKRNNTGTGGIAFLNGIGSSWNGYGLSSNLTDETDYVSLPVPYFFWNIYCLAHELGHNLGAKHTQWCGWPGGPIDNCTNIEEMVTGDCDNYVNSPAPEIGTIMSYCHTWSFNEGGGIIMKFHDLIKINIVAYAGLQNLDICNNESVIYGCMNEDACNYNIFAINNDDSCIYPEDGYDCFGNCLIDENQDGICDDNILSSTAVGNVNFLLYPNPASNYIIIESPVPSTFRQDIILFNKLGKMVLTKQLIQKSKIDVSHLPAGLYSVHIIKDDTTSTYKIIIQ